MLKSPSYLSNIQIYKEVSLQNTYPRKISSKKTMVESRFYQQKLQPDKKLLLFLAILCRGGQQKSQQIFRQLKHRRFVFLAKLSTLFSSHWSQNPLFSFVLNH